MLAISAGAGALSYRFTFPGVAGDGEGIAIGPVRFADGLKPADAPGVIHPVVESLASAAIAAKGVALGSSRLMATIVKADLDASATDGRLARALAAAAQNPAPAAAKGG